MPLDWRLRGTGIIFVLFYERIVRSDRRQKAVSLLVRNKLNTLICTVRTHSVVTSSMKCRKKVCMYVRSEITQGGLADI
jgi:hypothetical protein